MTTNLSSIYEAEMTGKKVASLEGEVSGKGCFQTRHGRWSCMQARRPRSGRQLLHPDTHGLCYKLILQCVLYLDPIISLLLCELIVRTISIRTIKY